MNACHGFSLIAGVVDTGDKFIAGDKNKDAMEVGSCQRRHFLTFLSLIFIL
jgi:hypothetical protein